MLTIAFFHGWAFDNRFFNKLKQHLKGFNFIDFERGYFGKKSQNLNKKVDIVITHSMGLWHFLDSGIEADKVFSICGFKTFCINCKQKSIVQKMLDKISIKNIDVLRKFLENTGTKLGFKSVNFELLASDLNLLKTMDYSEKIAKLDDKIIFINAKNDQIVYNKPDSMFELKCGHALGMLKSKEVSEIILSNL
jgi:hypothetical protein